LGESIIWQIPGLEKLVCLNKKVAVGLQALVSWYPDQAKTRQPTQAMRFPFSAILLFLAPFLACGADVDQVRKVELQPLLVQVDRLKNALQYLGEPLPSATFEKLEKAKNLPKESAAIELIQNALDPFCLAVVTINPESRVKVAGGPAVKELAEHGWRNFLVKVINEAGVTAPLKASSPNALPSSFGGWGRNRTPPKGLKANLPRDRWLGLQTFDNRPLSPSLSGLKLEYRIAQLYSRDSGKRAAVVSFDVGQGTQDLGFRSEVALNFKCLPATAVNLKVLDENGKPTIAEFLIKDRLGRVYPSQAKRLAPDFHFHPQVYRGDGEKLLLPPGEYDLEVARGPESIRQKLKLKVGNKPQTETFRMKRWIDPSLRGWWSGDHHIHAAGCAHYVNPTEGVHAPDMMRHCIGEDLKVGANLTWGPCFDYQKQFFTGKTDPVSRYPYLLRYDVEVSGFGSHRSGHLCLLRLKEQVHPGGDSKHHWPTLCLNTLKWAQKQGAVCGPAHSGWGLKVSGNKLPTYEIPPFDGIGACEFIVDVTHEVEGPKGSKVPAVDFISMVDTPSIWELNIWYHVLNCGFRTRISGETDFPCIYGERVGLGRSYVKVKGKLDYDRWCAGIEKGAAYVSDGRSHLMDFLVGKTVMGEGKSELHLPAPGKVRIAAKTAALLPEQSDPGIMNRPLDQKPYWHVERARTSPDERKVRVELIRNGYPIASKAIPADGSLQDVEFETEITESSWLALRIFPSSHTNPVFVIVDQKPIRASRRSAEWCLKSVDQCWSQKQKLIAKEEQQDAVAAYEHARNSYRKILEESKTD